MKPKLYTFTNSNGDKVKLPGNLTIKDLVKMGIRNMSLRPKEAPKSKDPCWFYNQ